VVNGLGVIYVFSHGDLTWNDKDLKMLDAIRCIPRVSLISKSQLARRESHRRSFPSVRVAEGHLPRLTSVMSL
jgi:hypothetical protein